MSNIDYRQHFIHALNGLRAQGMSIEAIIALVIGDTVKNTSPAASVEPVRMVSIELANGMTKNVPWTPDMDTTKPVAKPAPPKIDTHAVTNAPCVTEWVKPEGFVPDVIPAPAPKPKYVAPHEIIKPQRGSTSYDLSVVGRYSEEWVPPVDHGTPTPAEQAEVETLIADTEREIAEIEATLTARRAEYAQFKTAMAGSDAS